MCLVTPLTTSFADFKVGETSSLCGKLDSVLYNIFGMKEPNYTMKLMATYGSLTTKPAQKETKRTYKKDGHMVSKMFKYTEPFANHCLYCHAVDNHNNLCHSVPAIEETWVTHRWANRVFAFLLVVSEVNVFLFYHFFVRKRCNMKPPTLHNFRRKLALALMENSFLAGDNPDERQGRKEGEGIQRCTS